MEFLSLGQDFPPSSAAWNAAPGGKWDHQEWHEGEFRGLQWEAETGEHCFPVYQQKSFATNWIENNELDGPTLV